MLNKFFLNYKSLVIFFGLLSTNSLVMGASTFDWYGASNKRSTIKLDDNGDLHLPASVYNNTLNVYSDVPNGNVYGSYLNDGVGYISENKVNVVNSKIVKNIRGAYVSPKREVTSSEKVGALNNLVKVTNSSAYSVYGGSTLVVSNGTNEALHNVVKLSGNGTVSWVCGGEVVNDGAGGKAEASYNTVEVIGPISLNLTVGGYNDIARGTAITSYNQVIFTDVDSGMIYGGYARVECEGSAKLFKNRVFIKGGRIADRLYASLAYGREVTINDNELILSGNIVFSENKPPISGGFNSYELEKGDVFTGNTLRLWNYTGNSSAGIITNFQNYDFILPASLKKGETLLSATKVVFGDRVTGKSSRVTGIAIDPGSSLKEGDLITLIRTSDGIIGTIENDEEIIQTATEDLGGYKVQLIQDRYSLKARILGSYALHKTLLEGHLAKLALVNEGEDFLQEMRFSLSGSNGLSFFMTTQGERLRYKSSNLDVDGWSVQGGLALKWAKEERNHLISVFLERGQGKYDSYDLAMVGGNGKLLYTGVGIFGRFDFKLSEVRDFYIESFLRLGGVEAKFSRVKHNHVNSSSSYRGFSLGVGYDFLIGEKVNLDFYGKYSYTGISSDSLLMEGIRTKLRAVNSHRLRGGARLSLIKGKKLLTPYLGLAYEQEFDSKVNGWIAKKQESLTLKGCTGIGEVGVSFKPSEFSSLSLDLSVQGFIGVRQGVAGKLNLKKLF